MTNAEIEKYEEYRERNIEMFQNQVKLVREMQGEKESLKWQKWVDKYVSMSLDEIQQAFQETKNKHYFNTKRGWF